LCQVIIIFKKKKQTGEKRKVASYPKVAKGVLHLHKNYFEGSRPSLKQLKKMFNHSKQLMGLADSFTISHPQVS